MASILFWDLETSRIKCQKDVFSLHQETRFSHKDIIEPNFIICGGYKWLGKKKTEVVSCTPEEAKNRDDSRVVNCLLYTSPSPRDS